MVNYYDVHDILCSEERIECEFLIDAVDCGYLDTSCIENDIEKGRKVELPMWFAIKLYDSGVVKMNVPKYWSLAYRKHVRAGPASVHLRDSCPYFYKVGKLLSNYVPDQKQDIQQVLCIAFGGERYKQIMDYSMNSNNMDNTEFTRKLTYMENTLYDIGKYNANAYGQWKRKNQNTIKCAGVLENSKMKKRKIMFARHL